MMEQSDLQTAVDNDLRKTKRYRVGILAAIGLLALVAFVLLVMKYPGVMSVAEEETPIVPTVNAYDGVSLTAQAAIVYDLATGEMLYGKNAEAQLPLASLTKLLTVYAAADALSLDTPVVITASALAEEGESGFVAGEVFAFEHLARLALVASSNDAASAIAEAASNKRASSGATLLASAAEAAGLTQTYATNGTGLDESVTVSGGYGSAHDVALLAGALLKKAPEIAQATTESSVSVNSLSGRNFTQNNTNPEAARVPGSLLSKTGYTDLAGGNLAVVFDAAINHPIAIVVLGSTREGRFTDVDRLLERTLLTLETP